MEIVAHDPFVSTSVAKEQGIRMAKLDEVYAAADYLTLHVGLTPQTANMINAASLKKMKAGVRLVNCARGELVNEAALLAALESGHVAGAGLDVFEAEPPADPRLVQHPKVIATPHIAGSTEEAQKVVGTRIAEQLRDYLKTGAVKNAGPWEFGSTGLSAAGLGLVYGNVPALAILLVLPAGVLIHRIFVEEAVLTEVTGRAYADYAARTKRLVPGLW